MQQGSGKECTLQGEALCFGARALVGFHHFKIVAISVLPSVRDPAEN